MVHTLLNPTNGWVSKHPKKQAAQEKKPVTKQAVLSEATPPLKKQGDMQASPAPEASNSWGGAPDTVSVGHQGVSGA